MKNIRKPLGSTANTPYLKVINQLEGAQYTFYPRTIGLEDIDKSVYDWLVSKEFVLDGIVVPIFYLSTEKWADFKKRWKYMDGDKNVNYPYVTCRRVSLDRAKDPERGTIPGKKFNSYMIPTHENAGITYKYYTVSQPIRVDLTYEIRILTNYISQNNKINEDILRHFAAIQSYIDIDKHYMPLTIESLDDESTIIDEPSKERILHTVYSVLVKGYIIREEDFSEKTGIADIRIEISESE